MRHLTIISHTEHYTTSDGSIVGLGSTVTEINHLLAVFELITHIAMLHDTEAPRNALPYASDRIKFVALPAVGGIRFSDKVAVLLKAPQIIGILRQQLKTSDYFQFRAPTGIGVYVIPYLILCHSKKGWFKYAGNWKQEQAPLVYQFQRWLLTQQSRPVTINGIWEDQPAHCLSFENPCLTEAEVSEGLSHMAEKPFHKRLNLCFVGRLEPAKGLDLIFEAITNLPMDVHQHIGVVHLVGEGAHSEAYKRKAKALDTTFIFHGLLSRTDVQAIYKDSHAILLPSASEGFPKVIAEAINYGCIPIVSDVSSISHSIVDGNNGFLMTALNAEALTDCLLQFFVLSEQDYKAMTGEYAEFVKRYTYSRYNQRLLESVV